MKLQNVTYCRPGTKAVTHGRFTELNRLSSSIRVSDINVVLDHVDELMNVINASSDRLHIFLIIKQLLSIEFVINVLTISAS